MDQTALQQVTKIPHLVVVRATAHRTSIRDAILLHSDRRQRPQIHLDSTLIQQLVEHALHGDSSWNPLLILRRRKIAELFLTVVDLLTRRRRCNDRCHEEESALTPDTFSDACRTARIELISRLISNPQ
jgi:hypothetical protein